MPTDTSNDQPTARILNGGRARLRTGKKGRVRIKKPWVQVRILGPASNPEGDIVLRSEGGDVEEKLSVDEDVDGVTTFVAKAPLGRSDERFEILYRDPEAEDDSQIAPLSPLEQLANTPTENGPSGPSGEVGSGATVRGSTGGGADDGYFDDLVTTDIVTLTVLTTPDADAYMREGEWDKPKNGVSYVQWPFDTDEVPSLRQNLPEDAQTRIQQHAAKERWLYMFHVTPDTRQHAQQKNVVSVEECYANADGEWWHQRVRVGDPEAPDYVLGPSNPVVDGTVSLLMNTYQPPGDHPTRARHFLWASEVRLAPSILDAWADVYTSLDLNATRNPELRGHRDTNDPRTPMPWFEVIRGSDGRISVNGQQPQIKDLSDLKHRFPDIVACLPEPLTTAARLRRRLKYHAQRKARWQRAVAPVRVLSGMLGQNCFTPMSARKGLRYQCAELDEFSLADEAEDLIEYVTTTTSEREREVEIGDWVADWERFLDNERARIRREQAPISPENDYDPFTHHGGEPLAGFDQPINEAYRQRGERTRYALGDWNYAAACKELWLEGLQTTADHRLTRWMLSQTFRYAQLGLAAVVDEDPSWSSSPSDWSTSAEQEKRNRTIALHNYAWTGEKGEHVPDDVFPDDAPGLPYEETEAPQESSSADLGMKSPDTPVSLFATLFADSDLARIAGSIDAETVESYLGWSNPDITLDDVASGPVLPMGPSAKATFKLIRKELGYMIRFIGDLSTAIPPESSGHSPTNMQERALFHALLAAEVQKVHADQIKVTPANAQMEAGRVPVAGWLVVEPVEVNGDSADARRLDAAIKQYRSYRVRPIEETVELTGKAKAHGERLHAVMNAANIALQAKTIMDAWQTEEPLDYMTAGWLLTGSVSLGKSVMEMMGGSAVASSTGPLDDMAQTALSRFATANRWAGTALSVLALYNGVNASSQTGPMKGLGQALTYGGDLMMTFSAAGRGLVLAGGLAVPPMAMLSIAFQMLGQIIVYRAEQEAAQERREDDPLWTWMGRDTM